MAKSPLATATYPAAAGNFTKGRPQGKPDHITVHHMAGVLSAKQCGGIFQKAGRKASASYGIGNGGEIANYVDEADTPWSDSNWNSNCKTISIETSNCATGGDWPIGAAAFNSLIKLVADIAKRNGLGHLVPGKNLNWHSMYASTTCPGNWLRAHMQELADKANAINEGQPQPTPPAPQPQPTPSGLKIGDKVVPTKWVDWNGTQLAKTRDYYYLSELNGARAVLRADSMTGAVYAAINVANLKKYDGAAPAPAPTPAPAGFKVGDQVVPTKLVDYNGRPLAQYDKQYTITELNGDRAVLSARETVWAAMNTANIRKA